MRTTVLAVLLTTALGCRGGSSERNEAESGSAGPVAAAATIDAGCGTAPPTQTARAPAAASSGGAAAGISLQAHLAMQPFEWYVAQTKVDVVVATVEEILTTHAATNANPPRVRLRIDEVIRGDPAADRSLTRWTVPGPPDSTICPPVVGDSFVLLGTVGKDGFAHVPERRVRATPESIALARKGIELQAEHQRKQAEEAERQRREKDAALTAWRERARPAELRRLARTSDLVAIGRPSSGAWERFQFEVKRTISGQLRGQRWVDYLEVDDSVSLLLSAQDRDVLLFLDDTGEDRNGAPVYTKVGYGVFPADPELVELVESAARRR